MFNRIRLPRRLVLISIFVLQLLTLGASCWILSRTWENVEFMSNVTITEVDAIMQTTEHLSDARITLSRAATRWALSGTVPSSFVQHARNEIDAADRSFLIFLNALRKHGSNDSVEGRVRSRSLIDAYYRYSRALTQLVEYIQSGDLHGFLEQPTQDVQAAFLNEERQFLQYGRVVGAVSVYAMHERFRLLGIASSVMAILLAATAIAFVVARRREKLNLLSLALNHTDSAAVVTTPDGRVVYANEGFTQMLGYKMSEMLGKRPTDFVVGPYSDFGTVSDIRAKVGAHLSFKTKILVYSKSGHPLWILATVNPVFDARGVCKNVVGIWTDITSTKIHEELQRKVLGAMAREEPLANVTTLVCHEAERIAPAVTASIRRIDDDGKLWTLAAPSLPMEYARAIDGLRIAPDFVERIAAGPFGRHIVFPTTSPDEAYASHSALAISFGFTSCWWHPIRSTDGRTLGTLSFYYRESHQPSALHQELVDASLNLCALALEREGSKERIRRLAFYDGLTGLPNRQLLMSQAESVLAAAVASQHSFAVMFVDLNSFKQVNDTLGHAAGDGLLSEVAQRLKIDLRDTDIVGRLSGDEFVIVLSPADIELTLDFAERTMNRLRQPVQISDTNLTPAASMGIAIFPQHGESIGALMQHADMAMYEAKFAGHHEYRVFEPELMRAREARRKLGLALRDSLVAGELQLHYQPQVRLDDDSLYGVEALARWFHRDFGNVAPDHFIPLVEECGLVAEFNRWVLTEACRQLAQWCEAGLDVPRISVNISPTAFRDPAFASLVSSLLGTYKLAPSQLTLEVTEAVLLDATDSVMTTIQDVHSLGVNMAIDDFGTGYSSLSYLRRLPVNEVKLDKSFISNVENSENARSLVNSVADICAKLHLTIVAEGVETDVQRQILQARGYQVAQGYLFSPPIEAAELPVWINVTLSGRI